MSRHLPRPGLASAAIGALLLLCLLASLPSLGNGFTYDDIPIVRDNPRVHDIASPLTYLGQSYWPPGVGHSLYRPVTIQLFALEWKAGGGSPVAFHAANMVLYALVTLAVFVLARMLLPFIPAFAAAALFAVHPVHVEAVANVVGQAELLCALAALAAVILYLKGRDGGEWTTSTRMSLVALAALSALAKEQGFMLPALLVMAEVTVVRRSERWRVRVRDVMDALAPMLVILAAIFVARILLLRGMGGGSAAMGLRDLGIGSRGLTAAAMVPEWVRLLVWPAHLRSEYSPPEFTASSALHLKELFGIALAVCAAAAWFASRRAQPVIAFGLGWMVIAILPVTNLLFVTGVIIAERTLFLPSVGVVLAAAALGEAALVRWPSSVVRATMPGLLAVGLMLGVSRSWSRSRIWRDNMTLFTQSVADAPRGYRAHMMSGITLGQEHRLAEAEQRLRRAAELYTYDARVFEELSHIIRRQRNCKDAIPFMQRALHLDSSLTVSRSRLYYCQLQSGDVLAARETAATGESFAMLEFTPLRAKADSMLATSKSARRFVPSSSKNGVH